jgi:hypothetical protein
VANIYYARPEKYLEIDDKDYAPSELRTKGYAITTKNEYQPRWVKQPPAFSPEPFDPPLQASLEAESPILRRYRVVNQKDRLVRLQLFYFPGWTIHVDGRAVEAHPVEPAGIIEFDLPAGEHAVEARFGRTPTRLGSELLSAASLGAALVVAVWRRRRAEAGG